VARSGSFGTSLSPFGTGTLGNLGQYNVGDSLRDLTAYANEIAWGNGDLTDAQYQASLAQLAAAAEPNTQAQLSAQNKLEDVTYRIERSEANAAGLDSLIAFEQRAIAGMNPDNLRYRDLKTSLDSDLAQRRSRDYGVLMDAYTAGETSTEALMAWVENTLGSLPPDAPDADNWASVRSNLAERIVGEKDAQVYQDYQDRKMSPADFLAYLAGRRDVYDPSSPKWTEADRRLRDAQKNVTNTALAVRDQEVARKYADGKISDNTWLVYLGKRIAALPADDPSRSDWEYKLSQAAYSIAEDKLRHEVSMATSKAGDATARKNLSQFYSARLVTLNPGSAEARALEEAIRSLTPAPVSSGGGGGGGAAVVSTGAVFVPVGTPKVILSTASFDYALAMLTPTADTSKQGKKDAAVSVAYLRTNLGRAQGALEAQDKVWLYSDPRYPGQMVTKRNPDGTTWRDPVTGKSVLVPGSVYRAVSSDEVAAMQNATATYSYGLASIAAANGDAKGYADAIWHADEALSRVRSTQATAIVRDLTAKLDATDKGVAMFTRQNNPVAVASLLLEALSKVRAAQDNLGLNDAQREKLENWAVKVEGNPLLPEWERDAYGERVLDASGRPTQIGGVNVVTGEVPDNLRFLLKTSPTGQADWGWVAYNGPTSAWYLKPDGSPAHITVLTSADGKMVPGEVAVTANGRTVGLWVTTQDGTRQNIPYSGTALYGSYVDGFGNKVEAYSVDGGKTWVQGIGGVMPSLELNVPVDKGEAPDGSPFYTLPESGELLVKDGKLNPKADITWFGQRAAEVGGDTSAGVGAQGAQFRIATLGDDGALDFILTLPYRGTSASAYAGPGWQGNAFANAEAIQQNPEAQSRAAPPAPFVYRGTAASGYATPSSAYGSGAFATASTIQQNPEARSRNVISVGSPVVPPVTPPTLPPMLSTISSAIWSVLKPVTSPILSVRTPTAAPYVASAGKTDMASAAAAAKAKAAAAAVIAAKQAAVGKGALQ